VSPAFLEFVKPKPRPEFYGVTPRPYWMAYESNGKTRDFCAGPGYWHIPNGPTGQHLWPSFAFEWPSTAFKSYLCQKYDLAQNHPTISGPILYGGQPLEDLDWDAEPVMEITEFAWQVLELALFDDALK
jgi:hypothetical protein